MGGRTEESPSPHRGAGACGESAKRPKEERSQSKTSLRFKLLGNCFLLTDSNFGGAPNTIHAGLM